MAEVKRMTQTAIVRELAETTGVNNKISKQYMDALSALAVRETKKNGVFILPGIGRLVRADRKAEWDATLQPAKRSRFPPKRW